MANNLILFLRYFDCALNIFDVLQVLQVLVVVLIVLSLLPVNIPLKLIVPLELAFSDFVLLPDKNLLVF